MTVTQQQLHDAYSDLYDKLNDAYWAASTIDSKDRIHGIAEMIYDILSDLNAEDIKSRNEQFLHVTDQINAINSKLKGLQDEIASIIHNVQVANQVVGAATKAISFATTFFG